jgi:hypothetical protein
VGLRDLTEAELVELGGLKDRCQVSLRCVEHNYYQPCDLCALEGGSVGGVCQACGHVFREGVATTGERACQSRAEFRRGGRIAFEAEAAENLAAREARDSGAREARERAEREARERAARERAEREARERAVREAREREARERAAREGAARTAKYREVIDGYGRAATAAIGLALGLLVGLVSAYVPGFVVYWPIRWIWGAENAFTVALLWIGLCGLIGALYPWTNAGRLVGNADRDVDSARRKAFAYLALGLIGLALILFTAVPEVVRIYDEFEQAEQQRLQSLAASVFAAEDRQGRIRKPSFSRDSTIYVNVEWRGNFVPADTIAFQIVYPDNRVSVCRARVCALTPESGSAHPVGRYQLRAVVNGRTVAQEMFEVVGPAARTGPRVQQPPAARTDSRPGSTTTRTPPGQQPPTARTDATPGVATTRSDPSTAERTERQLALDLVTRRDLQQRLSLLGFDTGGVDGVLVPQHVQQSGSGKSRGDLQRPGFSTRVKWKHCVCRHSPRRRSAKHHGLQQWEPRPGGRPLLMLGSPRNVNPDNLLKRCWRSLSSVVSVRGREAGVRINRYSIGLSLTSTGTSLVLRSLTGLDALGRYQMHTGCCCVRRGLRWIGVSHTTEPSEVAILRLRCIRLAG